MQEWMKVLAGALPVVALLLLVIMLCRRCCFFKGRKDFADTTPTRNESLPSGIAKLQSLHHQFELENKRKANYYAFRRGVSAKPFFNWADHPLLVSEAVEHGWSRFAFTVFTSSPSTRSTLLLCGLGDEKRETGVEISWQVFPGSVEFMQKIRLNSGLKKINSISGTSSLGASSVIKTGLPLPGPPLGNSSFPQEAYFEITILYCQEDDQSTVKRSSVEGELSKLIQGTAESRANSDSSRHVTSSNGNNRFDESKLGSKKEDKDQAVMLSIGLTGGGSLPLKLPGTYPGSIGFNSNGSVYFDGMKLVFEAGKAEWGRTEKVIGCGFDLGQKKVFFTVDSELLHVIYCKSEDFGSPLYPTLAANTDVLVLINFGQSAFSYAPANAQRTPNPCFIDPLGNAHAAALGYEDSRELFSMGRIDTQWLDRSTTKNTYSTSTTTGLDIGEDSEADLFEIVLDNCGRSPSTVRRNEV